MSTLDHKLISLLTTIKSPKKISKFQELVDRSKPFLKHAPSSENWLHKVGETGEQQEILVKFANASYPILHEDVLGLVSDFLEFKKLNGNEVEKKVYKDLNFISMIERLINCRPLSFYGPGDKFFLRNFKAGYGNWHRVGTKSENPSVSLRNYMSYDEIKLSAFLQVSSPVLPINAGSRTNKGIVDSNHVQKAVYVGAVGARFEKEEFMEFQDMVVTNTQNTRENGYGSDQSELTLKSVFAKFYNIDHFPVYTEFPGFFNDSIYLRRIQISIETFLIEANSRGSEFNKSVYIHIVGLGLGVWMLNPGAQKRIYLEAFHNSLTKLRLPYIACLDFSWFDPHEKVPSLMDGKIFPDTKISIRFSKNDPFGDLEEKNNYLVVALYAWDGNSFPGNEYWCGDRTASGDPAAACCTQIPQLQNAYINCENICSSNLHVASCEYGLLHVSKYAQKKLEKNSY